MIKAILFVLGFFPAMSFMRTQSSLFNRQMESMWGSWFNFGRGLSVGLFALCLGLYAAAVWYGYKLKFKPIWRSVDFSLLTVWAIVLFFACGMLIASPSFAMVPMLGIWIAFMDISILLPAIAYIVAMGALGELVARIRDHNLQSTLYWVPFFKENPVWRPIGATMGLILIFNLFTIFNAVRTNLRMVSLRQEFMLDGWLSANLFYPALLITALTYFAVIIINFKFRAQEAAAEATRAALFKAELITNVSHDIKTPLTSIISYVDLLKTQPQEFESHLAVLEKKAARLKQLIDDLMEASKAGTGSISVQYNSLNLTEMLGQLSGEFDEAFTERDLTLVLRHPDTPVIINADSRHLWRALENLFTNAAKYAMPGTRVFAEISQENDETVFALKNTSQTPIDQHGDTLTEQFIRGDRARHTEGSGLGLYIAKSLVELMGGRLAVQVAGDLFEVGVRF